MAEKTIGDLIDSISSLDDDVDRLRAKISKINSKREDLEHQLMKALKKAKLNKAAGVSASANIHKSRHLNIVDLEALNRYVARKKAFDLYQRRLNSKAYFDRLEDGEKVPGVDIYEKTSVRITKKRS